MCACVFVPRWTIHPLAEQLKVKAKEAGLWNLWMTAGVCYDCVHVLAMSLYVCVSVCKLNLRLCGYMCVRLSASAGLWSLWVTAGDMGGGQG